MSRLPPSGVSICARQVGLQAFQPCSDTAARSVFSPEPRVLFTVTVSLNTPRAAIILDGPHTPLFCALPARSITFNPCPVAAWPWAAHDSARLLLEEQVSSHLDRQNDADAASTNA
ncbi:hypothetical protein ACW9H6_05060 [Pseudomonas sp. SDO528_S397]